MKLIRIITLIFLLFIGFYFNCQAQEAGFYGARNESLARATVALNDPWSLFYNPAGLVYQQMHVLAGYQSKYVSLGINDGVFGFTFPIKNMALGFGATYFGDNLLSKSKFVTGVAHSIGKTSLGIKATYNQLRIHEIGSKGILYFDIGGHIKVGNQLTIGMVIKNINQAKFDTLTTSNPNTLVQIGINYQAHDKLIILAQVEKDIATPALLRLGLEYKVTQQVSVRTGIVPLPTSAFIGFGLDWQKMKLDFVGSYQQSLGWSGGLSIEIPIISNEE